MSKGRPTPKQKRPRPHHGGPRRSGAGLNSFVDELLTMLMECKARGCTAAPSRWYVRTDVRERRSVVIPVCSGHYEAGSDEACPPDGSCLAPDSAHYVEDLEAVQDPVMAALQLGYGVAVPEARDWSRLVVLRPQFSAS
jgi:hypothetical protein